MNLEGHKFHFNRDDDGKIFAENEIETDIANQEGWLLPPRKGERRTEHYRSVCGFERIELTRETTGELNNGLPVYIIANVKDVREGAFDSIERSIDDFLHRIIIDFAILARSVYLDSSTIAQKMLRAVRNFVESGECDSNADEDSVCGGTCPTCRESENQNDLT